MTVSKPFDYLTSINLSKKNIMEDDLDEKVYNPFLVNRTLSYFPETVLLANEINKFSNIPKRQQYEFFLNVIPRKKRFAKWASQDKLEHLEAISEYFGYSLSKAEEVYPILTRSQIEEIVRLTSRGGRG